MASDDEVFYRICATAGPGTYEIDDYDTNWARGQFHDEYPKQTSGAFAYLLETILAKPFKSLKTNISITIADESGYKKKDGTATGCYRSIRDNETDISMMLVDFPTDDFDQVEPYQVFNEDVLKIFSGYRSETNGTGTFNDFILNSIKSFDDETWFAVFVLITCFFGLLILRKSLFPETDEEAHVSVRRTIAQCVWETFLHFISHESTDYDKFADRCLSIFMTMSFFFLANIYFGLMSTDLVSVSKPFVISSFQDIMNQPNVTPVFLSVFSDQKEFEEADDKDSIQFKFWEKYKSEVQMVEAKINPTEFGNIMNEAGELNRVLIMNAMFIEGVRRMACRLKVAFQQHEDIYTWLSQDQDAKGHQRGLIMRKGLKETRQIKTFRKKVRHAFETEIILTYFRKVVRQGINLEVIPEGPYSKIQKCLSDELVMSDASVDTVVLQNLHILFTVTAVMLTLAVITLLLEIYGKKNVQVN